MTTEGWLRGRARHLYRGIWAFQAESERGFRRLAGATATVALDTFVIAYGMGMLSTGLARRWHSDISRTMFSGPVSFASCCGMTFVYTILVVAAWTFLMVRWLRYMRWSGWWAVAYVFGILCPAAWVLTNHILRGLDSLTMVLLQLPVIITYILRFRSQNRPSSSDSV